MGLLGIEQGVASMMYCSLCPSAGLVSVCWKLLSWICCKLRSAIPLLATLGIVFVFGHVLLVTSKHGVFSPSVKPTEASGPTHWW